jgi:CIC family chloride channel protein
LTKQHQLIAYITIHFRKVVLHIPPRTLLILICILIGVSAGFSAFLLKSTLHYVHELIQIVADQNLSNLLRFVLPIFGLFLSVLYVKIFHKHGLNKGVSPILFAIKKNSANIDRSHTYGHIFSSALTIGFGGSAGFEAPIVATGSAIGSNIARYFKFSSEDKALLLASGAAAGISAIFNAPIAGVLFAIEVLLVGIPVSAFIPLLLASATGAIVSKALFQEKLFILITNDWEFKAIPIYILLGIAAGLYSVLIMRQSINLNKIFSKIQNSWLRVGIGGVLLSTLIFIFPSLYGEGYFSIQSIFNNEKIQILNSTIFPVEATTSFTAILVLLFVKIFATGITISSGGNGGIFAPSLFMGGFLGFLIAGLINKFLLIELNIVNFTVAGMAGVLSGVIKIPLTAVFLIAEITGGYALFVPLMIVSASSYFTSSYFENKSIYTKELEKRI